MSNCYVNVCGGLGNQLFQIAAGYAYSIKHDKNLYIDVSNWTALQGSPPSRYRDTVLENFNYDKSFTRDIIPIYEREFNYTELPFHHGNVSLNGYFQSLKYFKEYKDEFVKELSLPNVKTSWIKHQSIAFHIRRGDYLTLPHIFNVCDTEYFKKLFEEYASYEINVFTDSPQHVLKEFDGYDFKIIQGKSELEDLTMMANHPNIVCSNSSFSWWASLLGIKKDKIIVPSKWLLDRDCSDIYYEGMIKI